MFHAMLYASFIETKNNIKLRKVHRTNQGSNFLRDILGNIYIEPEPRLEEKDNPSTLKYDFPSRKELTILMLIASQTLEIFPSLKTSYFVT